MDQPKAILTDKTHYILVEDFVYEWKMQAQDADDESRILTLINKIVVKQGFRWDGASVPKILWGLGFKPDGDHRAAALVHDFIYIYKGKLPEGSMLSSYDDKKEQVQYGSFSRKDSDRMFGRMMREAGVPKFRRTLMKWAVQLFGWLYWKDGTDIFRNTFIKFAIVLALLFLTFRAAYDLF